MKLLLSSLGTMFGGVGVLFGASSAGAWQGPAEWTAVVVLGGALGMMIKALVSIVKVQNTTMMAANQRNADTNEKLATALTDLRVHCATKPEHKT